MPAKKFRFHFKKSKLEVPKEVWSSFLEKFQKLNTEYNPKGEYRKQFYFQYAASFEAFGEIEPHYEDSVPRAVRIIQLIEPTLRKFIPANSSEVAFIGSHCAAECIFFGDLFPAARVEGFEENPLFVEWSRGLAQAYGYKNLTFHEESIESTHLTANKYDYIAAHGLLYMSRNPIQTVNQMFNALKPGGLASLEVYTTKDRKPTMKFVGDGSGWGDTFAFSPSFLPELLKSIGFSIVENFAWGGSRQVVVSRKMLDNFSPLS